MDCLNVSGPVTFLVDTGANISLLSLADATRLGVDYAKRVSPRSMRATTTTADRLLGAIRTRRVFAGVIRCISS